MSPSGSELLTNYYNRDSYRFINNNKSGSDNNNKIDIINTFQDDFLSTGAISNSSILFSASSTSSVNHQIQLESSLAENGSNDEYSLINSDEEVGYLKTMSQLPSLTDWTAVLFECFLIITLGYLSSRFKLISHQAKDLHSYLATFALPMIIFLNIAQMEFQQVNWSFLICMISAKLIVFMSVTTLTLFISQPTNFGYAGALSILATQSNDFALGYPLIKSIYGENEHDMLNYLSLQVPIQLLLFNPLGIAMLEYEKSRRRRVKMEQPTNRRKSVSSDTVSSKISSCDFRHCACQSALEHPTSIRRRSLGKGYSNDSCNSCLSTNQPGSLLNVDHGDSSEIFPRTPRINCQVHDHNNNINIQSGYRNANDKATEQDLQEIVLIADRVKMKEVESKIERQLKMIRGDMAQSPTKSIMSIPIDNSQCSILSQNSISRDEAFNGGSNSISVSNSIDTIVNQQISSSRSDNVLIETRVDEEDARSEAGLSNCDCHFLISLAANPLIIASIGALIVNLVHGPSLPKYVTRVSNTIAASYAAPALFVIGVSMFGKFELLRKNPSELLLSGLLVLAKLLLLPNLMRILALIILPKYLPADESSNLVDFSYLYGSLPTAPTAVVIAQQYGVLTNVVSLSMLISTIFSAPLLLGIAIVINPTSLAQAGDSKI